MEVQADSRNFVKTTIPVRMKMYPSQDIHTKRLGDVDNNKKFTQ